MRAVLPTFYLITNDDEEIKVEPFATMGENGQCSISYVYNLNKNFDKNISSLLYDWDNVKYIKFDKTLCEILKCQCKNEDENAEFICVEPQELFNVLRIDDKFEIGISIVGFIVMDGSEDCNISYNISSMIYRCYQVICDYDDAKNTLKKIRVISQGLPDDYSFNTEIEDLGKDLSVRKDILTYGYHNMMIEVRKSTCEATDISFDFLYVLFDHFLMEKEKIYRYYFKCKQYDLTSMSEEELVDFRSEVYENIKDDLLYYFLEEEYFRARAVYDCLNMELHIKQLERMLERIDKTLVQKERFEKEQREKDEVERKELQESENKKREETINWKLQVLSILFSIPVVSDLVEIMYAEDMPKWICFPKSYAKLIWILVTSMVVLFISFKIDTHSKKKRRN